MTAFERFAAACPRHATDGDKIYVAQKTYRLTAEQTADFRANRAEIIADIKASRKAHPMAAAFVADLIDAACCGNSVALQIVDAYRTTMKPDEFADWELRATRFLKYRPITKARQAA